MKYKISERTEHIDTTEGHIEWLKELEEKHKKTNSKRLKLVQTLIKENEYRLNESKSKKDQILFGG